MMGINKPLIVHLLSTCALTALLAAVQWRAIGFGRVLEGARSHGRGLDESVDNSELDLAMCEPSLAEFCSEYADDVSGDSATVNGNQLLCLLQHASDLDAECQEAVQMIASEVADSGASGAIGSRCTREVQALCADVSGGGNAVGPLVEQATLECLSDHFDELGDDCQVAVEEEQSRQDLIPQDFIEARYYHLTRIITAFSIAALAVPLLMSIWAASVSRQLQSLVQQLEPGFAKRHGLVPQTIDVPARDEEKQISPATCELGFLFLSFWVNTGWRWGPTERAPPGHNDGVWPVHPVHKQILNDVSGVLRPGELTAIMGPSGSGKTTLLSLIGGHTRSGTFSGSRLLNGQAVPAKEYIAWMRRQGYVEQKDVHLETLTVWETLSYAAMLRLPETMSPTQKLRRAAKTLEEVDLTAAANSLIGGTTVPGISGGQRRRLSIALELLRLPQVLLLDEPTSGLDSASSLRLIQRLNEVARSGKRTLATTIHQPRADIFELFDRLILLGDGRVVYSGRALDAMAFFSAIPDVCISPRHYENPGDFIIDALNLAPSGHANAHGEGFAVTADQTQPLEQVAPTNRTEVIDSRIPGDSDPEDEPDAATAWRQGMEDGEPQYCYDWCRRAMFSGPCSAQPAGRYSPLRQQSEDEVERADEHQRDRQSGLMERLHEHYRQSLHHLQVMEHVALQSDRSESPASTRPAQPVAVFEQMWLLFARRVHRLTLNKASIVNMQLQVLAVAGIISASFSYDVDSKLELPYQVLMLLLIISSYTFVQNYLLLPTEYLDEWPLLKAEHTRGACSYRAYVLSCLLSETPRGLLHSSLTLSTAYTFHALNPNPTNVVFSVVCMMLGVNAWQGMICACSMLTDNIQVVYLMIFLLLGGGTLFGGLLISSTHVPVLAQPIYYLSVTAVTQRALVVNDFLCCYLTYDCTASTAEVASFALPVKSVQLNGTTYSADDLRGATAQTCPKMLDSDRGNLGRWALTTLALDDVDNYIELFTIFCVAVLARCLAVCVLHKREQWSERLREAGLRATNQRRLALTRAVADPDSFAELVRGRSGRTGPAGPSDIEMTSF